MFTTNLETFMQWHDALSRPRTSRLLGIDHGKTNLGLALSTPNLTLATPLSTFSSRKFQPKAEHLTVLLDRWDVFGMIIGDPRDQHGGISQQGQSVRSFLTDLARLHGIGGGEDFPILLWDERFSSQSGLVMNMVEVERAARPRRTTGMTRKEGVEHAIAAVTILQSCLDAIQMQQSLQLSN